MSLSRAEFEYLDQQDPLGPFRDRFLLPPGIIYFDGNSLGAMPRATPVRVQEVIGQEWGHDLIRSWTGERWLGLQQRVGDKIGRLIGARSGETLVADSTSVNLFKMLAAALALRPDRRIILSENSNFPTDLYVADGLARLLGGRHALRLVEPEALEDALRDDVAVVMLTHVNYRTGRMWNLADITARAQAAGCIMLWDFAHSAGAVPLAAAAAGVDLAVGCGYKFLNGGPGAPAFIYVAERWQDQIATPLAGWFGHADPFGFEPGYRPAQGIGRLAVGTPPVISLTALEVGVDLMLEAPMDAIREKSALMGGLFIRLAEQELGQLGFDLVSPRAEAERGSQVCLRHDDARAIMQALIGRGVIGDFRAPDIVRFGLAPLYNRYTDIWDGLRIARHVLS
jgi:kynureninase